MTAVATQTIHLDGTKPTFAAAATGDTFEVGPACKLIVKNGAGSPITLTVLVPGNTINGIATPDTAYTVAATTGEVWVPLYPYYADPDDGRAHVTYSSLTTVTRAMVKG